MSIELATGLSIKRFDEQRWIVNTAEGRNLLMNDQAAQLLVILRDSANHQEALEKFQRQFQKNITEGEFEGIIRSTFKGLSILSHEAAVSGKPSGYLTLKVPLLNARIAGQLARPLSGLFNPTVFWWLFIAAALFTGVTSLISYQSGLITFTNINVVLLTVLVGASMLIHELGHIAACRQFGIKHGSIGFGFYLIFPVVYADITQVWNATRAQRIIANAGGVFAELIYAVLLLLIFISTGDSVFLLAAVSVSVKTFTELNPFIRYDGYWLLSDVTNTPNLQKKANQAVRNTLLFFLGRNKESIPSAFSASNAWLTLYGLMNTLLLIAYFSYVIFQYSNGIIQFPASVFHILQVGLSMKFSDIVWPSGFLWILGLYIIVIRMIIRFGYRKIKSISAKEFRGALR